MASFDTRGRSIARKAAQLLCARHGTAMVLASTLALAGSMSVFLDQLAAHVDAQVRSTPLGSVICGPQDRDYTARPDSSWPDAQCRLATQVPATQMRVVICGPQDRDYTARPDSPWPDARCRLAAQG